MDYRKFRTQRFFSHLFSMPFIWLPLIGVIILDILVTLYQALCFPIYGLEKVRRREYISIFDRSRLQYLEPLEKLGCIYCGYTNGFLLYAKEIAGRTEKYWCGIMHAKKPGFKTHQDQVVREFARFNDEDDFRKKYD